MTTPRKKRSSNIDSTHHDQVLERIERNLGKIISTPHLLWRSFLGGVMYAVGALVVVAIIVPFVISFLQSIQWPPLVADFVTKVIYQMEPTARHPQTMSVGQ